MSISIFIVVPTLNSYHLLPKLVQSLRSQSWPHWRLLFIDGPSKADHRVWLQSFCASEPRCNWQEQDPAKPGIFNAMNQGFDQAAPNDWVMFWGSDDWAAGPNVFSELIASIDLFSSTPDLLVCHGRYVNALDRIGRKAEFHSTGLLRSIAFRSLLFLGATPPHQATLIGPGARHHLAHYSEFFSLSADLDYFLCLSRYPCLRVQCLDLELVYMADGGVSGQQTQRRLYEVCHAYMSAFGFVWWFSFCARYIRRIISVFRSWL